MKSQPLPASALQPVNLAAVAKHLHADDAIAGHSHGGRTIVREVDLRVVLLALAPGAQLAEHHVSGSATIFVVDGAIRVGVGGESIQLWTGELLALAPGVAHDVVAIDRSTLMLTLSQPPSDRPS